MEWWQQLGFDSEEEAIARGESEEVFNRTRRPDAVDTRTDLEKETDYIRDYISNRDNQPPDTGLDGIDYDYYESGEHY